MRARALVPGISALNEPALGLRDEAFGKRPRATRAAVRPANLDATQLPSALFADRHLQV